MFLLYGCRPYVSIVWPKNICSENICSKNICFKNICSKNICSKNICSKNICSKNICSKNICSKKHMFQKHMFQKHMLQMQMAPLTMEPSAGHVIKYYKGVLVIICIAVGIKKFEIIVRRSGSLVVSVPSGSNSTLATT